MKVTKRCSKCKTIKPISEFNKDKKAKDRFQSFCKSCKRIYDSNYQKTARGIVAAKLYNQSEKCKATRKRYFQSEEGKNVSKHYRQSEMGKANRRAALKRFYANNPNHEKATNAVNHAVKAGKLSRPDSLLCHYCQKVAKQYHHHKGYEPKHWLEVVPVCIKCNGKCKKKTA